MAKDPYKLLGVPHSASESDIRKAYRALAKKLHPDVNPGNEKAASQFKEVSAAYTLLSDKKLKSQYDSGQIDSSGQQRSPFGAGGFGGGSGFKQAGGGDMNDLLQSLFGMNMGGASGGRTAHHTRTAPRRPARPQKGKDVRYALALSFFEALQGGAKKIRTRSGESLNVKIPAGVEDGKTLRLKGKGETSTTGGAPGDARIEVSVRSHKYFQRDGKDLHLTLPVSLHEAVMGAKVKIPMPQNPEKSRSLQMNIPAGSQSGKTLRLKGKGIEGGDLFVTLQVMWDENQVQNLAKWLEENPPQANFDPRAKIAE